MRVEPPQLVRCRTYPAVGWLLPRVPRREDLLTALDDGSEAALWSSSLAHRCFDFDDAYLAEHGHMPLSPAPQDMEGPSGSA